MKFILKYDADWLWYSPVTPDEKEFCCKRMREAYDDDAIVFDATKLNIVKAFCYPEGAIFDNYEISFCPFCGEKIVVEKIKGNSK